MKQALLLFGQNPGSDNSDFQYDVEGRSPIVLDEQFITQNSSGPPNVLLNH